MRKIDRILQQEVTRKEFLTTIVLAFVGLFGFSSIVGLFTKDENNNKIPEYGMGNYGP
jgi:hypothetical protein